MGGRVLKHIAIDVKNYETVSRMGGFHESFNDIITKLLSDNKQRRGKGVNEKESVPQGAQVTSHRAPSGKDSDSTSNIAPNQSVKEVTAA